MIKIVSFKCNKCEKIHTFEIGGAGLATLQDVIEHVPERDSDKLLDAVNRMLMNKTEAQRTAFMMNNADALSMINYDICGQALSLFDAEEVKPIYARYTPDQIDRLNKSMAMWETAFATEGFVAFNAMFYCRKCKRLAQGMYLKVRAVDDKKERSFVYAAKCDKCNGDMLLVNDSNMGYLFEGLTARAPCPDCGGQLVATDVKFKP